MRLLLNAYRLQTVPIAERFFSECNEVINTPMFGYVFPTRVSRTGMHRQLCLLQERFIAERTLLFNMIKRNSLIVDVGSNIGYYLLLFERYTGPHGHVICVEPEPDNLKELYNCIQINKFRNVEVMEAAVGAEQGELLMRRGINSGVCGEPTREGFYVPAICLDAFTKRKPDLVKIDIEGFEGQALAGAQQLLKAIAPKLFVEIHPALLRFGFSVSDILSLVRPHYKEIRFFKPANQQTLLEKISARYLRNGGYQEIRTEGDVLEACDSGSLTEPFWMICR